jgi:shikimate dehydrogenase
MPSVKKLAVIGDPIAHSLSPKLQNFLIRYFALPFAYEALHIRQHELPAMMQRLHRDEFRGINITIPHKQAVLPFLDVIDETAAQIGAVNTIVVENGKLSGYNPDALGFLRSLKAAGIEIADQKAFVLGAGGGARAVIFALLQAHSARIWICNRNPDRAGALMAAFTTFADAERLQNVSWAERAIWLKKNEVNLIINTTRVGMHPHEDESPLSDEAFSKQPAAVDLVYNPFRTAFLRAAHSAGAKAVSGLGMLIYQGVAALELWSNQALNIHDIYSNLEDELKAALH